MENKVGSIEVGKYADLVILEKNLFDVASDKIADVKVEATMMNGKFTYKKGEEASQKDQINENVLLASAEFNRYFMCSPCSCGTLRSFALSQLVHGLNK